MRLKRSISKLCAGLLGIAAFTTVAASLHNISYAKFNTWWRWPQGRAWAADSSHPTAANDARLKDALQKRLLVPDPKDLTIGPPTPGPFPGTTNRAITIDVGEGQKFEVELFSNAAGDKGVLAQHFALFDLEHPWERLDLKALHLDNRATLGPADAPIQLVEFADFECPYCARAFNEVETLVNTTYKGRIHLIWKNFPLAVHPWAEQAAIAAECAREQNPAAFWSFAGNFYRDQSDISVQNLRDHVNSYASVLNLDPKALNACVLANDAENRVEQDKKDGAAIHINSTPTFLINGIPVVGLPSSNVFDFVITSQLQERNTAR
jgi:protein-disulfide isomerase